MGYAKLGNIDNNKYKIKGTPVFKENNDSKGKLPKNNTFAELFR